MSGVLGIVVIARNEGERLVRCLDSLAGSRAPVVYVDSGSTDGSVEMARGRGIEVVELDPDRPFTMARGRNAGFERLQALAPETTRVQFVDGDCEVAPGWLAAAEVALEERADVAAVFGRRRERERERSVYNRITDMEWDGPPGEARFAGGDLMLRVEAYRAAGGYRDEMIAGEDPEFSLRLREAGWKLLRLDAEMTRHDAAMTRFGQWWTRTVRSGHAYAEGASLHRASPERPWQRECRSSAVWGGVLPAAALLGAPWTQGASLLLLALAPVQALRIARRRRREFSDPWPDCRAYGVFCMLAKPAQLLGQVRFGWNLLRGRRAGLMEYKAETTRGERH